MSEGVDEILPEGVAPTGSHRVPPATAAMIAILLLLGFGTSALRIWTPTRAQPSDVDLRVPDWRLAPDEIVAVARTADARRAAAPAADAPEAIAVLEAFEAFNAADLAHEGDIRSRALKDAHASYQQWARTALQVLGVDAFMGLGQGLADAFVGALKRGDREAVRRLSGSFSVAMRSTGLIDEAGRPVSSQAWRIAGIGFLTHWCAAVIELRPIDGLLSRTEQIALLRWKLAANPLLAPGRREAVGKLLRKMASDYRVDDALGARAAAEGDWALAAVLYGRAATRSPDDVRLRANMALAAARAGAPISRD